MGVNIITIGAVVVPFAILGALVDTDGNAATNQTLLGDIDMGVSTLGDLKSNVTSDLATKSDVGAAAVSATNYTDLVTGEIESGTRAVGYAFNADTAQSSITAEGAVGVYGQTGDGPFNATELLIASTNAAKAVLAANGMTTNAVNDIVTNTVVVGYTEWAYTGDTSSSQAYSITQAQSGSSYVFTLWDTKTSTSLGTSTTSELNPLSLSFTVSGGTIVATRYPKIRNSLGLARYADVQELDEKIDTMDTSYYRVAGITNKNQSVQYVATPAGTTTLQIQLPESGMTKDWLVYVLATDDLTLVLPPANYWVVSETVTNSIPASTPTALYFSQITDDTYSIGRQELIPITVDTQGAILSRQIREKMKLRGTRARILKSARPAESK